MSDFDARPDASRPPFYEKYDGPRPLVIDKYGRMPHADAYPSPRPRVVEEPYGRSLIEEEKMRREIRGLKEDHYNDLREVLQQKKKIALDPTPVSTATGGTALDSIFGNIPEEVLQIIDALSATAFLQVAYFKLVKDLLLFFLLNELKFNKLVEFL